MIYYFFEGGDYFEEDYNAVDQVENQMIEGMVKAFPQYVKKLDCGKCCCQS